RRQRHLLEKEIVVEPLALAHQPRGLEVEALVAVDVAGVRQPDEKPDDEQNVNEYRQGERTVSVLALGRTCHGRLLTNPESKIKAFLGFLKTPSKRFPS